MAPHVGTTVRGGRPKPAGAPHPPLPILPGAGTHSFFLCSAASRTCLHRCGDFGAPYQSPHTSAWVQGGRSCWGNEPVVWRGDPPHCRCGDPTPARHSNPTDCKPGNPPHGGYRQVFGDREVGGVLTAAAPSCPYPCHRPILCKRACRAKEEDQELWKGRVVSRRKAAEVRAVAMPGIQLADGHFTKHMLCSSTGRHCPAGCWAERCAVHVAETFCDCVCVCAWL